VSNRIYAYTIAGKDAESWERTVGKRQVTGIGLIKVGQTTKAKAKTRIKQQLGTAYPNMEGVEILLEEVAERAGGTTFTDHEVHAALIMEGIRCWGGEWFEATIDEVRAAINKVKLGAPFDPKRTESFELRPEQAEAVDLTASYFRAHADEKHPPKFLWNAKMRFGKTFTAYQLAKRMGWKRVLVLTYKPAVQAAWCDDLLRHVDFAGWHFVDRETSLAEAAELLDGDAPVVRFVSFQDLFGKAPDGQVKAHNQSIHAIRWDCLVIDEYHFGAWRDSARDLYDPTEAELAEDEEPDEWVTEDELEMTAANLLYLSGTPFRAITDGEFTEDAVFNWTYVDEQSAKQNWDDPAHPNPYIDLPGMEIYTYDLGSKALAYAKDGEFNSFSLSEYFEARKVGEGRDAIPGTYTFEDPGRVSEFLEMLRGKLSDQMKMQVTAKKAPFPYEDPIFTAAIRHSVWYLPGVASCFAMRDLLDKHPYFRGFEVVVAAGGAAGQGADAKPPVEAAIGKANKEGSSGSITLSCGKLMTGVTVPEWGAILMLRSLKSPETYFQAAFRVQSPWAYLDVESNLDVRKPSCYVFEFDPNRALALVAEYGVKLAAEVSSTRSESIGKLLDYLPIFGFTGGSMQRLDATEILDWATAGIGASALARRWDSPLLVDVNQRTLAAVLAHPELLKTLEQIEDFRALVINAEHVVTSTKTLKKAKREQGELDPDQKRQRKETSKQIREIREKLQKFLARIPVFMYATDFREEALKHVIESLDPVLFERVTGLTIEDFKTLSDLGLFNTARMDAAIYQFRQFERASLEYTEIQATDDRERRVGLWDRTMRE
jgi:hypothetical protein